ncbi:MAG: histone family protein [Euryarchaeota archaeon]|nr:histone family protein [Euryarchaeota archaeon]
MGEIPLAACDRIIRNATKLRVGNDAAALLAEVLEEIGTEIAAEAGTLAKHAGRRTVKASDIKLAAR